jgi:PPK2 family polyphosphate:nucleotide phosphotransferase
MDRYKIKPGEKVKLDSIDPADTSATKGSKQETRDRTAKLTAELEALQEQLYAEHRHKVLVVLQGMDTSGKDGTVRHVFDGVNPQGVRVASFKVPTPEEADHDYLWRVHKQTPAQGEIVIFNRSHYEDVLVVRVHQLVPQKVWKKRYAQINAFEKQLAEEGTLLLKFFLHISPDAQKERLLDRLNEPSKHWKFNPGDLKERALWHDYQQAYQDALEKTSTRWAPWYIVPADKKWYRDYVISNVLVDALKGLKIQLPPALAPEDVEQYRQQLQSE